MSELEIILAEITAIKQQLTELKKERTHKEWESIHQAEKILGIPRDVILDRIKNNKLPFYKNGSRYKVNIERTIEFFYQENIANMKAVQRANESQPFSKRNNAKDINNGKILNPRKDSKVRRVEI